MNIEEQYEQCRLELTKIEETFLPQIEELGEKIDAKFKAYAEMAHFVADVALKYGNLNASTSNKVNLGAQLFTMGMDFASKYQAAKIRNQKLEEMLSLKLSIANQKILQISDMMPRMRENVNKSWNLCRQVFEKEYSVNSLSDSLVQFQLKFLNLYRGNKYFQSMGEWMLQECRSWQTGKQTCGVPIPNYKDINLGIAESLFGKNLFEPFSKSVNSYTSLKGKEIVLISDPQLSLMALNTVDKIFELDLREADPKISHIIYENEGLTFYKDRVTDLVKSLNSDPTNAWTIISILMAIGYFLILFFCKEEITTGSFWISLIIGEILCFRMWKKIRDKIYLTFGMEINELGKVIDEEVETYCGFVKQPDIDYEMKNAMVEGLKGIFK